MTSLHPYLSKPRPKSLVQPWLVTELKEFMVDELPPLYPYTVRKGSSVYHHIPYFEFRGLGSPVGLDVGGGGDVYIDFTPGAYALWGYTAHGWKRWSDMGQSEAQSLSNKKAIIHPLFNYVLWIHVGPGGHRISWFKAARSKRYRDMRQWAKQLGLIEMPKVGAKKDEETSYREAAAILANLDLKNPPNFPVSMLPSTSGLFEQGTKFLSSRIESSTTTSTQGQNTIYTIPASWSPPPLEHDIKPKREHPCIINPRPVSHVQPKITSKTKEIVVHRLPGSYPYHLEAVKGIYRIPYLQFSDHSPPAENLDVGTEGDVYLDLTPGAYALYGRTANGWKRWVETSESLASWPDSDWLVKHPHLEDCALWVVPSKSISGTGSISWYKSVASAKQARTTVLKEGLITRRLKHPKSEEKVFVETANILKYVLGGVKGDNLIPPPAKLSLKHDLSPKTSSSRKKVKLEEPEFDEESEFGLFSVFF
ncbi:hypothetical protein B0H11DRAFT_2030872 [Mycena galericulata]|nr:hypothetical protein B0H11DRAFT_2030872 [Mycena galericulata]